MKCYNCKAEWSVSAPVSASIKTCPFCGADLAPKVDGEVKSLQDVLTAIISHGGLNSLRNGGRSLAMFSDLAPKLRKERTLFSYLVQCEGNVILLDALNKSRQEQLAARGKLIQRMVDDLLLSETVAQQACDSFWEAIGGSPCEIEKYIKPQTSDISKQNVPASNQTPKTLTAKKMVLSDERLSERLSIDCRVDHISRFPFTTLFLEQPSTNNELFSFQNDSDIDILVTEGVRAIPKGAFSNCENLRYAYFDSSLEVIEDSAFEGCSKLTVVVFYGPNATRNISENAFSDCDRLKKICAKASDSYIRKFAKSRIQTLDGQSSFVPSDIERLIKYAQSVPSTEVSAKVSPISPPTSSKASVQASQSIPTAGTLAQISPTQGRAIRKKLQNCIITGSKEFLACLDTQGHVHVTGSSAIEDAVQGWDNIVTIAAGKSGHIVGLRADGTVCAAGSNYSGQCDVSSWTDIVDICAGNSGTLGLKADGTVVYTGSDSKEISSCANWKDIVAISAGTAHIVGIKSDGTAIATGSNLYECCNVSAWSNISNVSAFDYHTVGLKNDGTIVTVGDGQFGCCKLSHWREITQVSTGKIHTVGLKSDGNVLVEGFDSRGRCNVKGWSDILTLFAGEDFTAGVKTDGTVVVAGKQWSKAKEWRLFDSLRDLENWLNSVEMGRRHLIALASERKAALRQRALEKQQVDHKNSLEKERLQLQAEMKSLNFLFGAKRRKEIEHRLQEIEKALNH